MADITKCNNSDCQIKESCFRWTAPPKPFWQSWGYYRPDPQTGECDNHLPLSEGDCGE